MVSAVLRNIVTSQNGPPHWSRLGHERQLRSVSLSYTSLVLRCREQRFAVLRAATELNSTALVPSFDGALVSSTVQLPPLTEVKSPLSPISSTNPRRTTGSLFNARLPRRILQKKFYQITDLIWSRPRPTQCLQKNGPALRC